MSTSAWVDSHGEIVQTADSLVGQHDVIVLISKQKYLWLP